MTMYRLVRKDEEIDKLLNDISDAIAGGRSIYPGMSYEQGIEEATRWLTGQTEDYPYE